MAVRATMRRFFLSSGATFRMMYNLCNGGNLTILLRFLTTHYQQGFEDGLRAARTLGETRQKFHLNHAADTSLSAPYREVASRCATVVGQLISDITSLETKVRRSRKHS